MRLEDGTTVALLRPLGFMNLSGGPVQKALRSYGLGPDQVVCVHDDVEARFGQVRAKFGGGLGGHNGLRSVADRLGTRDFGRVRCGIGRQRAGDRRDLADWVLSPFEPDEDRAADGGSGGRLRRADRCRGHRGGHRRLPVGSQDPIVASAA